ncbi:MAG: hypothetical protein Q4P65_02840 [Eubacteriales bacterium]|nr:hypothetical protein [Eubacteriales bacterium]
MRKSKILILIIVLLPLVFWGCSDKDTETELKLDKLETKAALEEVARPNTEITESTEPSQEPSKDSSEEMPSEKSENESSEAEENTSDSRGSNKSNEVNESLEEDGTDEESDFVEPQEEILTEPKRLIPSEDKVPLAMVEPEAFTGVDGRLSAQFFYLLSQDPLFYQFREWKVDKENPESEISRELLILLSKDSVYMKLIVDDVETVIVKPENSAFYLLDQENYVAQKLSVDSKATKQISAYAFSQIGKGASKLVYTGSGEAKFHGHEATFEEYRNGLNSYVRYYFDTTGKPLGHRLIENGKWVGDIEILELKNEVEERFFKIPAIYEIIND